MQKKHLMFSALAALIIGATFYMNPLGLRNNNPLNIKTSGDNWLGSVGSDGTFVIFETPLHGLRAAGRILKTYATRYGLTSIDSIISRWAPESENDTQNYINFVSKKTGIDPAQTIDREQYPRVMAAMIHMENGSNPFSIDEIREGFEWGFYG